MNIKQAKEYIQMGSKDSVKRMEEEMYRAADAMDFERAALLRDRIQAVSKAGEKQKILDAALAGDWDRAADSLQHHLELARDKAEGVIKVIRLW